MNQSIAGTVFDIQRCAMHDGPGIRTTVFLKGCPLSCKWCHNPESQAIQPQLAFYSEKCTRCEKCKAVCPNHVHSVTGQSHTVSHFDCTACGKCVDVCPNHALKIFGRQMTVKEIMEIVKKDHVYYETAGGGLTVSGGEPFMQHVFLKELLMAVKEAHIHTCIETSGFVSRKILEEIMPYIDFFLYDYKVTTSKLHKAFTGADHVVILDNLRYLYGQGKQILLRCPIIPDYNATEVHFAGIHHMETEFPNLAGIEILPYHNLGRGKAAAIGQIYEISAPTTNQEVKNQWKKQMTACGCSQAILDTF